jgi:hypothetical protein
MKGFHMKTFGKILLAFLLVTQLLFGVLHEIPEAMADDGWIDHDSLYANWDHLWFSWFGYRNPTSADLVRSKSEGWWGQEVRVK